MKDSPNGVAQDIHDNVVHIRGSVSKLEFSIEKLASSVEGLATSVNNSTLSTERTIKYVMESNDKTVAHVKNSLPLRVVLILCGIIVLAFVGGGVLKELLDSNAILKLFGI